MLEIHLRGYNTLNHYDNLIEDVEMEFAKIKLTGREEERKVLQFLEQAEYFDDMSFVDRFGDKRHIDDLSTGCKAIMVVLQNPDTWVDTKECGLNALSILISVCKDGKVIINDYQCKFPNYNLEKNINVRFDGKTFTDYSAFNQYFDEV